MTRSRTIEWRVNGIRHWMQLPDVEARGATALGCWVTRSPIPGTPRWEWVVTNMPVTAVTGMSAGYTRTRWGARRAARRALAFWASYGYPINEDGAQGRGYTLSALLDLRSRPSGSRRSDMRGGDA